MVAIDMEKPTDCKKCPLVGAKGNPTDPLSPMMCVAIWAITHEIKYCVGGKICDDCPLVEIEESKTSLKPLFCKECGITEMQPLYMQKFCRYCGARIESEK